MKTHVLPAYPAWYDAIGLIRVVVGYMFLKNGLQVFDTDTMEGYVDWSGSLGFRPAEFWAYAGKLTELVGGFFLMLGLFTRIVCVPLAISMIVITFMFHKGQPFNGDEYPFMLFLFAVLFFITGPGKWSLDHLFLARHKLTA